MSKIKLSKDNFVGKPRYSLLDPVLDLLLSHGNELATSDRWCSNPTGYFALLKRPIDFDLVESKFDLPTSVSLDRSYGEIDYGNGTVVIRAE